MSKRKLKQAAWASGGECTRCRADDLRNLPRSRWPGTRQDKGWVAALDPADPAPRNEPANLVCVGGQCLGRTGGCWRRPSVGLADMPAKARDSLILVSNHRTCSCFTRSRIFAFDLPNTCLPSPPLTTPHLSLSPSTPRPRDPCPFRRPRAREIVTRCSSRSTKGHHVVNIVFHDLSSSHHSSLHHRFVFGLTRPHAAEPWRLTNPAYRRHRHVRAASRRR